LGISNVKIDIPRTYTLAFDSGQPFYQVGTDGGLLEEPVEVSQITLTAGERADVIVDFSKRKAR
jgi:spore coat protein A